MRWFVFIGSTAMDVSFCACPRPCRSGSETFWQFWLTLMFDPKLAEHVLLPRGEYWDNWDPPPLGASNAVSAVWSNKRSWISGAFDGSKAFATSCFEIDGPAPRTSAAPPATSTNTQRILLIPPPPPCSEC